MQATPVGQSQVHPVMVAPRTVLELRDWDNTINQMVRRAELQVRQERDDTLLPERRHERLDQYYQGVKVFGGDVTRQMNGPLTVSVFGGLYTGIDIDPTPTLSVDQATDVIKRIANAEPTPELVVLPREPDRYVLAYRARIWTRGGPTVCFIDAHTGDIVDQYSDLQTQAVVRRGRGVLNDDKKVSMTPQAGTFVADDQLRPPVLRTFDMKGNLNRTIRFLDDLVALGAADLASTSAEIWTDGPSVDAQVHQGWAYDFYFKRFGRRGIDNNNIALRALVHPVRLQDIRQASQDDLGRFYANAFYAGDGVMVYGEGVPGGIFTVGGRNVALNPFAGAFDVVAHELTHGVTDYSSRLIYRNESGALNEAFSDIMGTSAEFFFQSMRGRANYSMGEDLGGTAADLGFVRSLSNPLMFDDPDHFSRRFQGTADNGGVHTNSTIASHAFYLAIEGGTNRTSGLSVQGVGAANREQIEKVFYRGFVFLMPSNATFAVARRATIQAAQDLYGAGSGAERAVTQAWAAVGVN